MLLNKLGARPAPREQGQKAHGLRVLYVEDDIGNWEVTELALRDSVQLKHAKDAREAISILRQRAFDLVLMDVELGGSELNGIELVTLMRGRMSSPPAFASDLFVPPNLPIVFVTAYQARYSPEDLERAGGTMVVYKPVDFARLQFVIARLAAREATAIVNRLGGD